MKNVILLNDTSYENHHGCNIVIKNIKKNLEKRNIYLLSTNPIGIDWKKNKSLLNSLAKADGVIINGEGTIHHDSDYAYSLLEIVEYTEKPCFLINTTYQTNSKKFSELVSKFNKVYVRESFSKKELEKDGITSIVVPDMTFYALEKSFKDGKENIYITDSHDIKRSKDLYELSLKYKVSFLPIISPFEKYSSLKNFFKRIKYLFFNNLGTFLNKFINLKYKYKYKRFIYVKDEDLLLEKIQNSEFLISARFHAICLSLHFQTPFVAISSNTFKIEALLNDIGLTKDRIIDIDALRKYSNLSDLKESIGIFTKEELEKILNYNIEANLQIEKMFDEINLVMKCND